MSDTPYVNLGIVSAYADAKRGGYTGTYNEFCALLAGIGGLQPKLTAGQNISITGNVIDAKAFPCNPNLLDNWYFGNPVNQRDGKIIQQGVNIYKDSTLETLIGPAAYACPVVELTSTYAKVQDTENASAYYYAAPGNVVQGYAGNGYGIDRWQILSSGLVLTISDGCITISNTEQGKGGTISAKTEVKNTGSPVVMSVLLKNGSLFVTTGIPSADAILVILKEGLYAGFRVSENNCLEALFYFSGAAVAQESIVAVKLELGSQQTLAHQENGAWVLNEIPDYGEQLRRCQRYCVAFNKYDSFLPADNNDFVVELPVPMRAVPTIINPQNLANANVTNPTVAWYNIGSNQLRLRSTASHGGSQAVCDGLVLFSADL